MIHRYSSRQQPLGQSFISDKLAGAQSYDRIAGFFRSSIFEVAGEALDSLTGKVRVICNSELSPEDVITAKIAQQAMRRDWCSGEPEKLPEASHSRFKKLYEFLASGKMDVRVLPDEAFGLVHGKAGIITLADGRKTCFMGSTNESLTAWKLNYEMVWEDDSPEAIEWVENEFNALWNHHLATPLSDFVIQDIKRISKRVEVDRSHWQKQPDINPAPAIVETPVYRKEFGLWPHQKYFVKKAFDDHLKGGARYILADQVGLGKTVQLALAGMLMALQGSKPVLVIAPKPLTLQWQDELMELLDMPSAIWTGKQWLDEQGISWPATGPESILKCPRKMGIVSQGLITSGSGIQDDLLAGQYECIIVDEAHRSRRKNISESCLEEKADPNNLMHFLMRISKRTKSMLLATATPVQLHPVEAFDLLSILALGSDQVLGDAWSEWRKADKTVPLVMGETEIPDDGALAWSWVRNPLPQAEEHRSFKDLRKRLHMPPEKYVADAGVYNQLRGPDRTKLLRVLPDYGRQHNPFIRHIIRRTRDYLEATIDPKTGEPYLKPVKVELFGEGDKESIPLPLYFGKAYKKAEEFSEALSQRAKGAGFFKTLLLRRIGSTLYAGQRTVEKLLNEWGRSSNEAAEFSAFIEDEDDADDRPVSDSMKDLTPTEIQMLKLCKEALESSQDKDPKYLEVQRYLFEKEWLKAGCIIFSQYYDSVWWLATQLSMDHLPDEPIAIYAGASRSGIMTGGQFKKISRDDIKKQVRSGKLRLVLGTDAASEGLNLQRLGTLINLDLPWNPTRLEQRKGRIQRIGQARDTVKILNMRYQGSVEDRVHELLSDRLEDIHGLFGQIPDVLEDAWVDIAQGKLQEATKLIDGIRHQHPFDEKYSKVEDIDWESCETVLSSAECRDVLSKGW